MIAFKGSAAVPAGRVLLVATRAGYGAALVAAPGAVICRATGRIPGRGVRRAARLLGVRHLIQAAISAFAPLPGVLAVGAGVDALHGTSMIMLATADRGARRAALTDALAEALFAVAGLSASLRCQAGR